MKTAHLNLLVSGIILLSGASADALEKHYAEEGELIAAQDYIGIYMQVPRNVQKTIGLKIVEARASAVRDKVHLNGRVPQDVDDIVDVYTSQRGILHECLVSLGQRVAAGETLCTVFTEEGNERMDIKAPGPGIVIAEFIKPGERADTISPLLTLADYSKIPVNFDVYEKDIRKIKLGQKVLVYSRAYPDTVFEGKVTFISPRIDETTFTLKIRALVDNPDYLLKPGMFTRGEAVLESAEGHVAVPPYSVQNLDGIDVVFVQDEEDSFVPTEVRVAYKGQAETIVSGEIYAGDRVVVDGAYNLKSKILESEIVGGCTHGH
ncbi:MAG: efflux RND transporter periplasmic adaptor subunit [Candidatus Omnitrophica bacterium]|nr:efflux RND transporter periplasmic adaptor subunit [Candidatus Omnitrophota bacterium]